MKPSLSPTEDLTDHSLEGSFQDVFAFRFSAIEFRVRFVGRVTQVYHAGRIAAALEKLL